MASAQLQAFKRQLNVAVTDLQSPENKRHLANVAREDVAQITREQTSRAGVRPGFTWAVNGNREAPLESVRLPGPIVYTFDYRREIALVGLEALRAASPVQSGEYKAAHTILLDGVEVEKLPERIPEGSAIVLVNPLPYSRRIEIGRTKSGRTFVVQVPNRIYETVARKLLSRHYRDVAEIRFGYVDLQGAYKTMRGGGTDPRRRRKTRADQVRYPAIFIRNR